ncbi:ROK family protein [Otariodibacter oris]|uniref:Transcriptional regulator of PTS protein n=1 Tax=Otariodibacter oris TaxID=1032623 RepID=A0A420XIG1_9PAST|nr:ROK family protein [Otariodibacter oris]QGM80794.1 transcriptional regulator [Otariodibacter oris]RKR77036.1 transcriptional regulator of PTS gene [Otariodibacter oris]
MKVSSSEEKYHHLGRVYQLIDQFELISRRDIAKLAGYAPASITGITKKLIDNKFILERTAQNVTSRGRPAVGLSVSPFHWQLLCLIISTNKVAISLCELSGEVIYKHDYPISLNGNIDNDVENAISHFLSHYPVENKRLIAVSTSVKGKVDKLKSVITQLDNEQVECHLFQIISKLVSNKPIFINEHFQLWLLSESILGSLLRSDNVIFLQLDEFINLSVLLRGELLHRDEHKRMNIDRMLMPKFGEVSEVISQDLDEMRRYQLINQIGFSALEKAIDHYLPNTLPDLNSKIEWFCELADKDDTKALLILKHITDNLTYMLHNLIALFSIEKIMLCSPLVGIQKSLFNKLKDDITTQLLKDGITVDIVTSQYDRDSPMIPASAIKSAIYTGNLIQNIIQL